MYGYSYFKNFRRVSSGGGGFVWTDSDAEAYYNELVTQNGGDIDAVGLYSITLDTLKQGINDHIAGLKTDGVWSQLVRYYPIIGATASTHSVNAVSAASELLYVNAPTHGASGINMNGTNQYANLNNTISSDITLNSSHLMMLSDTVTTGAAMGGRSATSSAHHFAQFGSFRLYDCYSDTGTGRLNLPLTTNLDKVIICSRANSMSSKIFSDGTQEGVLANSNGTLPNNNSYVGAFNNLGSPFGYLNGNLKSHSLGLGLSDAEVVSFTNRIKTLQTLLGR